MANPYVGEVRLFAGSYPPEGWLPCQGQILPIAQCPPLFALIGATYGGNGVTTFAIPDLRGRAVVSAGQGPGLTNRTLAEAGGQESVALTAAQMPQHTHSLSAQTGAATTANPANAMPARPSAKKTAYLYLAPDAPDASDAPPAPDAVESQGSGQAHENRMPSLTANYMIAIAGTFPSFG